MVHRVKKACLLPPLPQQPKLCLGTEHGVFEGPHGLNQVKLLYYTALVCNGMAQAVRHYMVMAYTIMYSVFFYLTFTMNKIIKTEYDIIWAI